VRWLVPIAATGIVAAVWVALPERGSEQLMQAPRGDERSRSPQVAPLEQLRTAPEAKTEQKAGAEQQTENQAPPPARPAAPRIVQPAARAEDARRQAGDAARERAATAPPPLATESVTAASPPAAAPDPYPQKLAETVAVTSGVQAVNRRAPLGDIASSDATTRWRIVNGTAIQRSTDSGITWRDVEFTSPRSLNAGHSPAPSVLWLVGQAGTIYRTADGARFERVEFVDTSDLATVTAINAREATVTATDGRRFRTTDGGGTWTRQ
jgi:hypothetical protein